MKLLGENFDLFYFPMRELLWRRLRPVTKTSGSGEKVKSTFKPLSGI